MRALLLTIRKRLLTVQTRCPSGNPLATTSAHSGASHRAFYHAHEATASLTTALKAIDAARRQSPHNPLPRTPWRRQDWQRCRGESQQRCCRQRRRWPTRPVDRPALGRRAVVHAGLAVPTTSPATPLVFASFQLAEDHDEKPSTEMEDGQVQSAGCPSHISSYVSCVYPET